MKTKKQQKTYRATRAQKLAKYISMVQAEPGTDALRLFMENTRDRTRNGGSPSKVVEEHLTVERKSVLLDTLPVGWILII